MDTSETYKTRTCPICKVKVREVDDFWLEKAIVHIHIFKDGGETYKADMEIYHSKCLKANKHIIQPGDALIFHRVWAESYKQSIDRGASLSPWKTYHIKEGAMV